MKKIRLDVIEGPQGKIEDGDNVVGVLNEKHKKLWALRERWIEKGKKICEQNKINLAFLEVTESLENKNSDDIVDRLAELSKLIEIVNEILWFEIRKDFNIWTKPFIAVRKCWKVVWRKEEENILEI